LKADIEDDITMELSMVEIYNEEIRDLLSPNYPNGPLGGLKMLEKDGRMTIQNVTYKELETVENVMELVMLGNNRRSTSFTHSNSQSSRSHAVLQINIGRHTKEHNVDHEGGTVAKQSFLATLSIIDLAGSERAAATQNHGTRMKEGAKINQSLLALSNCIHALCAASKKGAATLPNHIPYRNSKLTRMLKYSLGGNCRTVMIVCVSPSSKDIEDTHNTLTWANRAKEVKTTVSRNTAGQPVTARQYLITIDQQNQRIQLLQAQLDRLSNPGPDQVQRQTFSKVKADAAAKEAINVLAAGKTQMSSVLPIISHGARQRALWDIAEMQIAAYQRELEEVKRNKAGRSEEEVAHATEVLESLIRRQQVEYVQNAAVSGAIQQEVNATEGLNRMFKTDNERTFGDAIEKNELVKFRTGVAAHRAEMEKTIAAARVSGYREAASSQADTLARILALTHFLTTSVQNEVDMISGIAQTVSGAEELISVASRLTSLNTDTRSQLASLLGRSSTAPLPPLPVAPRHEASTSLAQLVMMSPARRPAVAPSRALGAPVRPTPTKSAAAFHALPAARRILAAAQPPGSPKRAVRASTASPLRSALRRQHGVGLKNRSKTPKKTARWKDEAGKGQLDDRSTAPEPLVFSSPSEAGGAEQGNSDEWEEEESESSMMRPKIKAIALPKSVSMIPRASPPNKSAHVFGAPNVAIPSSTNSTSGSAAPSAPPAAAPAIPEWKRNRMLLGKSAGTRLSPLGEERESSSSPDNSATNIGIGMPSRLGRSALSERNDNATASPSGSVNEASSNPSAAAPSTSFFAHLARPTASSRAKVDSSAISKLGAPSRRVSSVGPQRNRRISSSGTALAAPYGPSAKLRKSRGSMLPGQTSMIGDASMANTSIDGLPMPTKGSMSFSMSSGPSVNPLGPPARALNSSIMGGSGISPRSGIARRSSYMPPPLTVGGPSSLSTLGGPSAGLPREGGMRGPRASMSMAALPRMSLAGSGLGSRASISNLRPPPQVPGVAVGGGADSSTLKPWR
jgi:kinesin family protein 18/19